MISVLLQGGLGNQLFQISTALALSYRINTDCIISTSTHFLPLQGRKCFNYSSNIFSKIKFTEDYLFYNNLLCYEESTYSFRKIPEKDNLLLKGYFQSEKYFSDFSEKIKEIFSENEGVKNYIDSKYNNFDFLDYTSLHVRRGDYLKNQDMHPVCSLEYYQTALKNIDYNKLMIFSDDLEWCMKNLSFKNSVFVRDEDYIELYLMSRCRNNIIANSSFSWWSAWLNKNKDKKIIAPNIWIGKSGPQDTQDLIPETWLKI